jgi:hypothetical protein
MENNQTGISPWIIAVRDDFAEAKTTSHYQRKCGEFTFDVHLNESSLWITMDWPRGGRITFRAAYSPDGDLIFKEMDELEDGIVMHLRAPMGRITTTIKFPQGEQPLIRYTTLLKPREPLLIPYWPRDVIPLTKDGDPNGTKGVIHASQVGGRSGLLYMSQTVPKSGSLLYLQNLTALNDYCERTGTSLMDSVGGKWPELGFALPPAEETPLSPNKEYVISDAFVVCTTEVPKDEFQMARQFLDLLAQLYLQLPLPQTTYRHWPEITRKSLQDLENNPGCWSHVKGHSYLNAYLSEYATPPESMVQLAVLLPILEYEDWSGQEVAMTKNIEQGLQHFYDEKVGSVLRWHIDMEEELDGSEEQKKPRVMDAWYLHHPLLNLSRMAQHGNQTARKLFLDSLEYVIHVAHEFKYDWPVFYNVDTLEVLKAETEPGKGGPGDTPGFYAHVMLMAWQITHEQRYLNEAKRAAKFLQGRGFDVFYQANNTAFSAKAMYKLWEETGDELYLNLSHLCLASIFLNVSLWDCNYGFGKNYSTFFALFPLKDAPYTAVYEEQEVFSSFHEYLTQSSNVLPSLQILLAEYVRFMTHRTDSYYPPNLPKDMLEEEPKTGQLDQDLWIPLEDLHDGSESSGQVGQEVYGAGLAFGVLTHNYIRVDTGSFLIFIDYPYSDLVISSKRRISLSVRGDARLQCQLRFIPTGEGLPAFTVLAGGSKTKLEYEGAKTPEGHVEYVLPGNQKVVITWKQTSKKKRKSNRQHVNGHKPERKRKK